MKSTNRSGAGKKNMHVFSVSMSMCTVTFYCFHFTTVSFYPEKHFVNRPLQIKLLQCPGKADSKSPGGDVLLILIFFPMIGIVNLLTSPQYFITLCSNLIGHLKCSSVIKPLV